ncbi:adenylyltransferase/cytidyltransferase family protein [Candidatus Gottesmanbacteria bacterium]|nr:adenylyltransferase/cytidyltransferase family protein [Candidatus Gottesmanbacteria bacterium]
MGKIITLESLQQEITKVRESDKKIVLVGGCFDIVHVGHIKFLKEAKKKGGCLFLLLESDETVKKIKGQNRPYFPQEERAEVLSSIKYVDFVLMMPPVTKDGDYDKLVSQIKPDFIAVTENDPILTKKKNQVKMVGGKLKIIPFTKTFSSSQLAKLLGIE